MKLKKLFLFAAIVSTTFSAAQAQQPETAKAPASAVAPAAAKLPSAKEILDNYVRALGGRAAIEKIRSRNSTGTVELAPLNLKGTFEIVAAPESRSYTKMNIAGIGELIEATDGKTAWSMNPIQGNRDRSGGELVQSRLTNDFYRDIRLEKLYPKMEVKGIEKLNGADAYVVVATPDGAPAESWYFDVKSGLLARADVTLLSPEGPQPMSIYYEDHRTVDGVRLPFRLRTQTPSFTIIVNSTEIKHGLPWTNQNS
jgi:zinc protease